jgi:hypothetical protein
MWSRKKSYDIVIFFVLVGLLVAILAATAGCSKPGIISGVVQEKSHYPAAEIKHYKCDRYGDNCEVKSVENKPEQCTLTIKEDGTDRVSEVEIPCARFDSYNRGDWWLRDGHKSPSPGGQK